MQRTLQTNKHNTQTRRKRPSLRSVAEHANLSPTTVSLALRGDSSISPETRQRVIVAARELQYEYTPRSKKVRSKRLKRLGFVMPDFGERPLTANLFYGQLLVDTEQVCQAQYTSLNFVILQRDHPEQTELPPALVHDVNGILLASPYPPKLIHRIRREADCPIVLLDYNFPGSPYDSVMSDDFHGAYQAIEYLIESGHRHIVMMTGRSRNPDFPPSYKERYRGYCEACSVAGIQTLPPAILPDHIDERINQNLNNRQLFQVWLTKIVTQSPRPDAFFCVGDQFALATLNTLQELNYRIPEDISVIGFDDFEISSTVTPPLTTVHTHRRVLAQVAVERVIERIAGDDRPPLHITVGTKFIVRGSTRAATRKPSSF